jgi:hypothetical protein
MNPDEERQVIATTQAQEWAKRHAVHYEPQWTARRKAFFTACILVSMLLCCKTLTDIMRG